MSKRKRKKKPQKEERENIIYSTWRTTLASSLSLSLPVTVRSWVLWFLRNFFHQKLQKYITESTKIFEPFSASLIFSMDRILVASYPINHLIRPHSFRIDHCWSTGFRLSPVKERQKLSSRWPCRSMASDSTDSSSSSSFAPSLESDPSDKTSAR